MDNNAVTHDNNINHKQNEVIAPSLEWQNWNQQQPNININDLSDETWQELQLLATAVVSFVTQKNLFSSPRNKSTKFEGGWPSTHSCNLTNASSAELKSSQVQPNYIIAHEQLLSVPLSYSSSDASTSLSIEACFHSPKKNKKIMFPFTE